jgi:hypothetical protein
MNCNVLSQYLGPFGLGEGQREVKKSEKLLDHVAVAILIHGFEELLLWEGDNEGFELAVYEVAAR